MRQVQRNWFPTLNDALESEGLVACWPLGLNLKYGESVTIAAQGKAISVYRDLISGLYERPVHYKTRAEDGILCHSFLHISG